MRHPKPVRLETAPTGGRKCIFISLIHHSKESWMPCIELKKLRTELKDKNPSRQN